MVNLSNVGRAFYGIAIAAFGVLTICAKDFPYMLIPDNHTWIPGLSILAYVTGVLLIFSGAGIVFVKKIVPVTLLLGAVLLLIFCFYFIPYQIIANPNFMHWGEWENAEKELALSAGAFVIAACFIDKRQNPLIAFSAKLGPLGTIIFAFTIICFGVDHFLYAKDAAGYVPDWIPHHIFWIYFTGSALIGSGAAIMLNIKRQLAAGLLGLMIFMWVLMLHIPKIGAASFSDAGGEVTSAFLALAYCGIAFVIAGAAIKPAVNNTGAL